MKQKKTANNQAEADMFHLWPVAHTRPRPCSPRRGRLWDLRRCTMTPMMSAALTSTTASTEKLAMAASFHTSGVSSTDLPAERTEVRSARHSPAHTFSHSRHHCLQVLHEGVLGYFLQDSQGTHTSTSEFQNSELLH